MPGWTDPVNGQPHPAMFDYHSPGPHSNLTGPADRRLAVSNTDALLRYGEIGSTAVTSDILRQMSGTTGLDFSMPTHLAIRNQATSLSINVDVPHLPWFVPQAGTYKVGANNGMIPAAAANTTTTAAQAPAASPPVSSQLTGSVGADLMLASAMTRGVLTQRFNLNQPISSTNPISQAKQIFAILRNITGLPPSDPTTWKWDSTTTPPRYTYVDAAGNTQVIDVATYRYLAQLAANIVDYMDIDKPALLSNGKYALVNDFLIFNWTGQQNDKEVDYVFGVEQPRVVINEAYASFDNDGQDPGLEPTDGTMPKAGWYRLNIFFELLNATAPNPVPTNVSPLATDIPASTTIDLTKYRVIVAKDTTGLDSGTLSTTGTPANPMKDDQGAKVVVSNWNPVKLLPTNGGSAGGGAANGFLVVGPQVILRRMGDKGDNFDDSRRPMSFRIAAEDGSRLPGSGPVDQGHACRRSQHGAADHRQPDRSSFSDSPIRPGSPATRTTMRTASTGRRPPPTTRGSPSTTSTTSPSTTCRPPTCRRWSIRPLLRSAASSC